MSPQPEPRGTTGNKLEELILFVVRASEKDEHCCAAKLDKILFYTDFRAYDELGHSVTGRRYRKLEGGPVPEGVASVVAEMERRRLCAQEDRRLVALREPDLSVFVPEELDIARTVVRELWSLDAAEVSERSHSFPGWQAAEIGEEIPYDTVFVDEPRPLTPEEAAWAQEVVSHTFDAREVVCLAVRPVRSGAF